MTERIHYLVEGKYPHEIKFKPNDYIKTVFDDAFKSVIDQPPQDLEEIIENEKEKALKIIYGVNKAVRSRNNLSKNVQNLHINVSEILDTLDSAYFVKYLEKYRSVFNEVFFEQHKIEVRLLKLERNDTKENGDYFFVFHLPHNWYLNRLTLNPQPLKPSNNIN